jgi:DNA-binding IscR family transcriptional regulator
LLMLKAAGFVVSRRGRDGGYSLRMLPEDVFIGPMLRAVDGPIAPLSCLSRTAYRRCEDCRNEANCELRRAFAKAYGEYLKVLETTSLAQALSDPEMAERSFTTKSL